MQDVPVSVTEVQLGKTDRDIDVLEHDLDLDGVMRLSTALLRYVLFIAFCFVGDTGLRFVTLPLDFLGLLLEDFTIFLLVGGAGFSFLVASYKF